jgi:hypothetical protein
MITASGSSPDIAPVGVRYSNLASVDHRGLSSGAFPPSGNNSQLIATVKPTWRVKPENSNELI